MHPLPPSEPKLDGLRPLAADVIGRRKIWQPTACRTCVSCSARRCGR